MAMATLKYRTQHAQAEETKQGAPVFDGAPAGFHQWEFRTTLRAGSRKTRSTDSSAAAKKKGDSDEEDEVKDESKSSIYKTVDTIVNGLRGDALQVAMDLQIETLTQEDGITKLIDAMRAHVFPSKKHEAKELYSQ